MPAPPDLAPARAEPSLRRLAALAVLVVVVGLAAFALPSALPMASAALDGRIGVPSVLALVTVARLEESFREPRS